MSICVNCDHLDLCHEGGQCYRIMGANYTCPCKHYTAAPDNDKQIFPLAPGVVFGEGAQDLSPVFQDMIRRMINPNKLTE